LRTREHIRATAGTGITGQTGSRFNTVHVSHAFEFPVYFMQQSFAISMQSSPLRRNAQTSNRRTTCRHWVTQMTRQLGSAKNHVSHAFEYHGR
jgi:hypothetical protein